MESKPYVYQLFYKIGVPLKNNIFFKIQHTLLFLKASQLQVHIKILLNKKYIYNI